MPEYLRFWLTEKGILGMNPAREVKTGKFSRTEGKTPAFDAEQVQKVLDTIDTSNEVGLRDRALLIRRQLAASSVNIAVRLEAYHLATASGGRGRI